MIAVIARSVLNVSIRLRLCALTQKTNWPLRPHSTDPHAMLPLILNIMMLGMTQVTLKYHAQQMFHQLNLIFRDVDLVRLHSKFSGPRGPGALFVISLYMMIESSCNLVNMFTWVQFIILVSFSPGFAGVSELG